MFLMSGGGTPHCRIMIQGQSNCYGVGARSELSAMADTGLVALESAAFDRVFIMNAAGTAYEALQLGVNNQAVTAKFGPEFGLAVRWTRETSRGNLYIDKLYRDGQPIATFQSDAANSFFSGMLTKRTTMNNWLATRGIKVRDVGRLWVQGESDSTQTQAYYFAQLEKYDNSLVASSPAMMIARTKRVIARIPPGTDYYSAAIVAAKEQYAAAHPDVTRLITYSNNFNADVVHLNAKGQLQLAYDAYSAFFNRPLITAQ